MIEANADMHEVVERQLNDVEAAVALGKAIAEGRVQHPALAAEAATTNEPVPAIEVKTTVQVPSRQTVPADPDQALRIFRLSICAVLVLVLFLVWLHERGKK